jgi:hypothetical protein
MLAVPLAGVLDVYAVPVRASVSDASNYHTIRILRSGADETGQFWDTRPLFSGELTAYSQIYFGQLNVGQGDVIQVQVTVTGAPTPVLYPDDFAIRCELTPRD